MMLLMIGVIPICIITVTIFILLIAFARSIVCTYCWVLMLFVSILLLCFTLVLSCLVIGSPISIIGFITTSIISLLLCAIMALFAPITIFFFPEAMTLLLCVLLLNAIFCSGSCPCIFLPISLMPGCVWYIIVLLFGISLTPLSWIWILVIFILFFVNERCISIPIQISLLTIIVCNALLIYIPGCICPCVLPFLVCYNLITTPVFMYIWFTISCLINIIAICTNCTFFILISFIKSCIDICLFSLIAFLIIYLLCIIPCLIIWSLLIPVQIICIWPELFMLSPICCFFVILVMMILLPATCISSIIYLVILCGCLCVFCELSLIYAIWQIVTILCTFSCYLTNMGCICLAIVDIIYTFAIPYLIWSFISCVISDITVILLSCVLIYLSFCIISVCIIVLSTSWTLCCLPPSIPFCYLILLLIRCSSPIICCACGVYTICCSYIYIPFLCFLTFVLIISLIVGVFVALLTSILICIFLCLATPFPIDPLRALPIIRTHQLFSDRVSFLSDAIKEIFSMYWKPVDAVKNVVATL